MTTVLSTDTASSAPQPKRTLLQKYVYGALRQRLLALLAVLAIIGIGLNSLSRFSIDGLPDISNIQVQVITEAPALGPQEVEQLITFPLEIALTGIPRLTQMRSISKYGLSSITVVFEDGTDVYFARQLVNERLKGSESILPAGAEAPVLGPVSTGLGEIFIFELKGDQRYSPMQLRTLMDWTVIPRLKSVAGVAEINPMGGFVKQYQVKLDPERLLGYGITPQQVFSALESNNANSGGGYKTDQSGEQTIIRGAGLLVSNEDIANVIVDERSGSTPIYVRDVAEVTIGHQLRQGVVTRDSEDGTVLATVLMRSGENANAVVGRVKARVAEIQKELPEGVRIEPLYDRTDLITKAIKTVSLNLIEGALFVTAILLLMLGSMPGALITAAVIPLSMMLAITGMVIGGVSGNLMSLGAIDFGLLVDGSVVLVENIIRRLSEEQPQTPEERLAVIGRASGEFAKPVVFAIGIITVVYIPIFGLSGVEGKLFHPMAFTLILALIASLVLTLTLVPLGCFFAFRKPPVERETIIVAAISSPYRRAIRWLMGRWLLVSAICTTIFLSSLTLVPLLGSEFVPNLSEGSLVINMRRPPAASLEEGARQTRVIERIVREFPEVKTAFSFTGHPELATDTNKSENSDVFVMLKPQKEWKTAKTQEDLVKKIETRLKGAVPGITIAYTQPIQQRVNELLSGDRLDIALRIFGPDIETLDKLAKQSATAIYQVPGAADVRAEAVKGLPVLNLQVDRQRLAQYGINVREVLDTIEATRAGKVVGTIYEGRQRFSLAVKFEDEALISAEDIGSLPVSTKSGRIVQLGTVVDITVNDGLAQVSHREGERVITVGMNVRGRDLGSFVAAAQEAVESQVPLPRGYRFVWGGQFENYQSAISRLQILVPLALALIFLLLYSTFGNLRPGILIFLNVPFSLVGGLIALYWRGMPLSVSAGVGFIALFGIAVLNGIVLISKIRDLEYEEGITSAQAAVKGALERLRPILTTTFVASIGFIPMAIATGAGAEVQRPLASVVIGGLITCTTFNLFALPVLYPLLCGKLDGAQKQRYSLGSQIKGLFSTQPPEEVVLAVEGHTHTHATSFLGVLRERSAEIFGFLILLGLGIFIFLNKTLGLV